MTTLESLKSTTSCFSLPPRSPFDTTSSSFAPRPSGPQRSYHTRLGVVRTRPSLPHPVGCPPAGVQPAFGPNNVACSTSPNGRDTLAATRRPSAPARTGAVASQPAAGGAADHAGVPVDVCGVAEVVPHVELGGRRQPSAPAYGLRQRPTSSSLSARVAPGHCASRNVVSRLMLSDICASLGWAYSPSLGASRTSNTSPSSTDFNVNRQSSPFSVGSRMANSTG